MLNLACAERLCERGEKIFSESRRTRDWECIRLTIKFRIQDHFWHFLAVAECKPSWKSVTKGGVKPRLDNFIAQGDAALAQ